VTLIADLVSAGWQARWSAGPRERELAARHVLDALGCAVAGREHPISGRLARWLGEPAGASRAEVLRYATLTHIDEFDSIHPASAVLPCASVVPAAFLRAAADHRSGGQLLDAVLAGSEIAIEAGLRFGGPALYANSWWPSALFGSLGAAAATCILLGLDRAATESALGICAAGLGGLLSDSVLGDGHYLLVGRAAADGVDAADAAACGMRASTSLLDGPAAAALQQQPTARDRPPIPHLAGSAIKPYPCARPLHAVVAALTELAVDADLATATNFTVLLPGPLLRFVTAEREPAGPAEAAASAACAIAAALAGRAADPAFFRAARPVPHLAVHLAASQDLARAFPQHWAATVEVTFSSGSRIRRTVLDAPGDPSQPLTDDEIIGKFRQQAASLGARAADDLVRECLDLDAVEDVAALADLLGVAMPQNRRRPPEARVAQARAGD